MTGSASIHVSHACRTRSLEPLCSASPESVASTNGGLTNQTVNLTPKIHKNMSTASIARDCSSALAQTKLPDHPYHVPEGYSAPDHLPPGHPGEAYPAMPDDPVVHPGVYPVVHPGDWGDDWPSYPGILDDWPPTYEDDEE